MTSLIERFAPVDVSWRRRKTELQRALRRTPNSWPMWKTRLSVLRTRLSGLPALQDRLRRYRGAGVEDRLREQSQLVHDQLNLGSSTEPVWRELRGTVEGPEGDGRSASPTVWGSPVQALIIDQPEDDLDNKFVFESIVPATRCKKRLRQFLFPSHDLNIPVPSDAESSPYSLPLRTRSGTGSSVR
jgi:hypothetical protein